MVESVGREQQRQRCIGQRRMAPLTPPAAQRLAQQDTDGAGGRLPGEYHPVAPAPQRPCQTRSLGGGPRAVQPLQDDEAPATIHLGSSDAGSSRRSECRTPFNDSKRANSWASARLPRR